MFPPGTFQLIDYNQYKTSIGKNNIVLNLFLWDKWKVTFVVPSNVFLLFTLNIKNDNYLKFWNCIIYTFEE